jgi:Trypsin
VLLKSFAVTLLPIALLMSCDGCPATPSMPQPEALPQDAGDASGEDSEFITEDEYEMLPVDPRFYLTDGSRDAGNRYSFTVMVEASPGPQETIHCSGVLLSPRLILTAGHCVCGARPIRLPDSEAHSVIDTSKCAADATIETVTYSRPRASSTLLMDEQFRSYHGKVRPHPRLEVLLGEQAVPLSHRANLAVIALEEPVESTFPAVALSTSELKFHESITIAGYGFDGKSDLILGLRRSGRKKVTQLAMPGNEGILFTQEGATFTTGSGEPCLRQDKSGAVLVGITTMDLREGPAFTSILPYREWLLSEIRRALPQRETSPKRKDSAP